MHAGKEAWLQERDIDTARHTSENPPYKPWWKRAWPLLALAAVVVLVIVIVVPVEVEKKKNRYPDYSQLSYTLADTCMSSLRFCYLIDIIKTLDNEEKKLTIDIQTLERISLITSITLPATILPQDSSTTFLIPRPSL